VSVIAIVLTGFEKPLHCRIPKRRSSTRFPKSSATILRNRSLSITSTRWSTSRLSSRRRSGNSSLRGFNFFAIGTSLVKPSEFNFKF